MTQGEFRNWLEKVLGETPMEELIAPEILEHINRVQIETEQRGWQFAQQNLQESFQVTMRAMMKTMFVVGYDAGRDQGMVDRLFGDGSGLDDSAGDDAPPSSNEDGRLPF
jgi:hypothetical protein